MVLEDLGQNVPGLVGQYIGQRGLLRGIESRIDPAAYNDNMRNVDPAGRPMLTLEQMGLVNANDNVRNSITTLSGFITAANVPQMRTEYFDTLTEDGQRAVYQEFLTNVEVADDANENLRNAAGAFVNARALRVAAGSGNIQRMYGILRAIGVEEPGVLLGGQYSRFGDAVGVSAVAERIANAQLTVGRNILRDNADARQAADVLMLENNENAVSAVATMYSVYTANQNLRRPVNP